MSYSDYGAFTWRNGERRRDKEDVGVYDTDEGALPSGYRIWANIIKNRDRGTSEWWNHSQHGVMGDGPVRVSCYKQGLPRIWAWPPGASAPDDLTESIIGKDHDHYEYAPFEAVLDTGYKFTFTGSGDSESGHYEATMTEPDGIGWKCVYDYEYGAGHTDAVTVGAS